MGAPGSFIHSLFYLMVCTVERLWLGRDVKGEEHIRLERKYIANIDQG